MFKLFKRDREPLNTVGHYGGNRGVIPERGTASLVQPKKQPYVRIEFDDINKPTVWIDGDKVEALDTLNVNWETGRWNRNSFGMSYTNSNNVFVMRRQDNTQPSCSDNDKPDNDADKHSLGAFVKDIAEVIERVNEAKKDGSILLSMSEDMFSTDVKTLETVLESMGYRCVSTKLAFEGEQISERLLITIEGDSHEDQEHTNRQ